MAVEVSTQLRDRVKDSEAPPGTKWCGGKAGCLVYHPVGDFAKGPRGGVQRLCRVADAAREQRRRASIQAGTYVPRFSPFKGRDCADFKDAVNLEWFLNTYTTSHVAPFGDPLSPCLLWNGGLDRKGYGSMVHAPSGGITVSHAPHRLAFYWSDGRWSNGDEHVSHQCADLYPQGDHTGHRCINPDHLKIEDAAENQRRRKDDVYNRQLRAIIAQHQLDIEELKRRVFQLELERTQLWS